MEIGGIATMKIVGSKERPSRKGPKEWFTGNVWLDEIAIGVAPSRVRVYRVSFDPGARTAWHTHPNGQKLHVLSGVGRVQLRGEQMREILPGDTVVIEPGEAHWHGAAPAHTLVHLAIQETDANGKDVAWLELVTDKEYGAG